MISLNSFTLLWPWNTFKVTEMLYEWVKLSDYHNRAKFDIYHICNVKVFATDRNPAGQPALHWSLHRLTFFMRVKYIYIHFRYFHPFITYPFFLYTYSFLEKPPVGTKMWTLSFLFPVCHFIKKKNHEKKEFRRDCGVYICSFV